MEARAQTNRVDVRLHGPVEVIDLLGGRHPVAGGQAQAVLARLLLSDRAVSRDALAEMLWGEGPLSDHWPGALRGVLAKVRAALVAAGVAPAALRTTRAGVVTVNLPPGSATDIGRATALLADARRQLAAGEAAASLATTRAAAETLGPGPFLPVIDDEWTRFTRSRLADLVAAIGRQEVAVLLALGRPEAAVDRARIAVQSDPLDEEAHDLLVRALLGAGRRADALAAFDHLETVLGEELALAPAPATAALVAGLRRPEGPRQAPSRRPGPPPIRAGDRFVGRVDELHRLARAWTATVERGTAGLTLVSGPAGIGKTRLAQELATQVGEAGGRVLWTRCRARSGLPYEAVAEALRLAIGADPGLADRLGPTRGGLAPLLPEVSAGDDARAPDDPAVARQHLFASVEAAVSELATEPTLWVVDDLHWIAPDGMDLLEIAVDGLARPLLVLATHRPLPGFVDGAMARLQRSVPLEALPLDGLSEDDLAVLVSATPDAPAETDRALARTLHARTAGHPLLASELSRHGWRQEGMSGADQVPTSLREWVDRRVAALARDHAEQLELAAAIGEVVPVDLLARARSEPEDVVLDRCEVLAGEGFLVEGEAGWFAFGHVLTRDIVYERLGATRRELLHRRIADALAAGPAVPGRAAALAHHLAAAGQPGPAADHGLAAGRESLARSAWALARQQLEVAVGHAADDPVRRARVLVELGRARHGAGDPRGARQALDEGIALARASELADVAAEGTLLLVGRGGRGAAMDLADDERAALLRRALAELGAADGGAVDGGAADRGTDADTHRDRDLLLTRLESELALALLLSDAADERVELVRSAVARARRSASVAPDHLAVALLATRLTQLRPDQRQQRIADLDAVLALPADALSPDLVITALYNRHEEHLLVGDRDAARADIERAATLVRTYQHPYWQWAVRTWQALGHLIDGDLERAEQLASEAASLQSGRPAEAAACLGVNLVDIRLYQGRGGEVVDLLATAAERYPNVPCYRAVLALCCAEAGRHDEAAVALDHFAREGFANLPDDTNRFLGLAVLADAAATLGQREAGAALEGLLAPYRELHVVLNVYGGGGSFWGPAGHQLARLAALAGRTAEARALFADARRRAVALGAPLAVARIEADERRLPGG